MATLMTIGDVALKVVNATSVLRLMAIAAAVLGAALLLLPVGDHRPKALLYAAFGIVTGGLLCSVTRMKVRANVKMQLGMLVLVACGVSVFWALSSLSCWCCLRPAQLEAMCGLASAVATLLEANSIPHWVCWGSLLGIVRETHHPLRVVPWEHDFDFCVHERDWARVVAVMSHASQQGIAFDPHAMNVHSVTDSMTMSLARVYVDFFRFFPSTIER